MSRRLYIGRLPPDARSEEVSKLFEGVGRIVDCRIMNGFGFIEYETPADAERAVHELNGKPFMSSSIVVEFAKESRRREYDDRGPPPRARRPPGVRVIVSGISRDTSWQDLKDFGREAGSVSFSDIDRNVPGQGILEYLSRDDADHAVKYLDGKELRGQPVRVNMDEMRGPDNYRRDDRRGGGDDRRDDRHRDYPPRRDRSRSPGHREERRRRSPPRYDDRRYDDRRGGDYEDRRGGGGGGGVGGAGGGGGGEYEERRDYDDRRRDDRRYDDRRDDRERAPRGGGGGGGGGGGESGWSGSRA